MASDVVMPRLSDSMEEGTILKWLVDEGGEVKRGEPLVEVETDKANMTYDADTDGVLVEVVAKEGDTLAVGEVIARIGDAGEAGSDDAASRDEGNGSDDEEKADADGSDEETSADDADGSDEEAAAGDDGSAGSSGRDTAERSGGSEDGGNGGDPERVKASPVARRMAREAGVELAEIEGSGPGGRIVKADVEKAGSSQEKAGRRSEAGAKGEVDVQELSRLQQTVSRRMAESKATAPDFALTVDVDMSLCVELRKKLKEVTDPEPAPSYNDMIVKAAASALRAHPKVNGAYRDGRFELYSRVNVGIAVAAQDALVVPTIFDADRRSLGAIAAEARQLADKVRNARITPPEVAGGTFTVSNLGMYGIDRFTAIINPPQAALLTVGSLEKRAMVDDSGRVVARDTVTLTLVCDHRIIYGAEGAEFLAHVRKLLEQPLALAL